MPLELESCIHEESAVAVQVTGFPQVPVVFSEIDCPGGSGCKRLAVNDSWAGAACSTQVFGGVGVVAGVDVPGAGVAVAGVVVAVMPVTVPVPVFTPGITLVDVDTGVPATGELAGVCVSAGHGVELTCVEGTMPVPVIAVIFLSGIV